jgi:hypothetical protein
MADPKKKMHGKGIPTPTAAIARISRSSPERRRATKKLVRPRRASTRKNGGRVRRDSAGKGQARFGGSKS